MDWYGARTVYQWAEPRGKAYLYEERIVVVCAESDEAAFAKAEAEAEAYAIANGVRWMGAAVLYHQDGDALIDGYEVWSVLMDSDDPYDVFCAKRYGAFEGEDSSGRA